MTDWRNRSSLLRVIALVAATALLLLLAHSVVCHDDHNGCLLCKLAHSLSPIIVLASAGLILRCYWQARIAQAETHYSLAPAIVSVRAPPEFLSQ